MRKSVNKMVGIRVAAALASVLLFSVVMTINILSIERSEKLNAGVNALLERAQKAEVAHYKWASNLSNALYAGTEFTGSTDPTGCVLGQWIYGEAGTDDEEILDLRSQLQPLHEELHQSAVYVLELLETDKEQAQNYYQETIQSNLGVLVGLLDKVVERGSVLRQESQRSMQITLVIMHCTSIVGLSLALISLISLVLYVLKQVVRPILTITEKARPLQEGTLKLDLDYDANDEIGDLARTLRDSMEKIRQYVEEINRMMYQVSTGDFNVVCSVPFIGDFYSIEKSMESFTRSLSEAIANINRAEDNVFGHAEHLSGGAQLLAQGAIDQAAAVEELYATLDELSNSAKQNIETAANVKESAQLTREQVSLSSREMEQLVAAMADISDASKEIGRIISTIEDIAFKTNILSLNAAVEATRAGEAGRGFTVVSSEVRNLAARSNEAAQATRELIGNSVRAAEKGNQIVERVSETLQKTLELVQESNDAISVITDAVHAEAIAISQVTEGLGQISAVVETNTASSEESATVSTELFEQVRVLQEQTNRFQLKS
ncbi:HAMP domain-containing protein [Parablautia intestinalis]|uniref:HAMP domain-containing protein n=1 Tax=Parablautia intestinalis TaxID=2320100 RepID=A0A3A9AE26_9FIRM|nr:methyl-accepting chemotaxis protein [Parablautia intestinalis]RKI89518.1 HAMP domain-containing protein [Parablautia intestinalis]